MIDIKERPILFSAPMVRAILEGRKTVTRRALKMPHGFWETSATGELVPIPAKCPYGKPGERLWVREAHSLGLGFASQPLTHVTYRADMQEVGRNDEFNWRPSIHMPRWASRILLEITEVRVERLQSISRSDIRAEGVQCPPELASDDVSPNYRDWYPAAFRELWNSTGGDWDANPWVWVVEFKHVAVAP